MKKLYYLFILMLTYRIADAQNLVLNGDFEQYSTCPYAYGQVNYAINWTAPTTGGTSDYCNQCAAASTGVSIPGNMGCSTYQVPHSGNAYAAIINYSDNGTNYREYLEGAFSSPLTANTCYKLEMYVSIINCCKYAVDKFGVYFSNSFINPVSTTQNLPYVPQISNPAMNFYTDTANWVVFSATYIAQGGEDHFIIGNFNPDSTTNKISINANFFYPNNFMYIDDVSMTVCTGIHENENAEIKIFPDPVSDELNIVLNNNMPAEIILYDFAAGKILQKEFTGTVFLNMSQFAKGIYFYEVKNKSGMIKKGKVMKGL